MSNAHIDITSGCVSLSPTLNLDYFEMCIITDAVLQIASTDMSFPFHLWDVYRNMTSKHAHIEFGHTKNKSTTSHL